MPRYAFGHGLWCTRFHRHALSVRLGRTAIEVAVAVRNDGEIAVDEVVQVYVGYPGTVSPRAAQSLKAFARVRLAPGETRVVRLAVPLNALRYRDPATHGWKLETGPHRIVVGRFAADPDALVTTVGL